MRISLRMRGADRLSAPVIRCVGPGLGRGGTMGWAANASSRRIRPAGRPGWARDRGRSRRVPGMGPTPDPRRRLASSSRLPKSSVAAAMRSPRSWPGRPAASPTSPRRAHRDHPHHQRGGIGCGGGCRCGPAHAAGGARRTRPPVAHVGRRGRRRGDGRPPPRRGGLGWRVGAGRGARRGAAVHRRHGGAREKRSPASTRSAPGTPSSFGTAGSQASSPGNSSNTSRPATDRPERSTSGLRTIAAARREPFAHVKPQERTAGPPGCRAERRARALPARR